MNRLYSPSILVVLALAMPACSSVPTEASPEGRAELAGQLFDSSDQLSLDEELMMISDSIPNFGGLWIDSAQAYVAIVGETSESETAVSISRIRDIVVRSRGELSFARGLPIAVRSVRYSFRELHTWRQAYDDSPTQQSVVLSDTDERHNTVTVGVAKGASISQVEDRLRTLGVPTAAVRISEIDWPTPATTLLDIMTPTAGGVLVSVNWSEPGFSRTKGGTLTGNVIWLAGSAAEDYFVTCAHCSAKAFKTDPPATWYQADVLDSVMTGAQEVADPQFFSGGSCPSGKVCRWSEAAIIKYGSAAAKWYPQVAWAPNPFTLLITKQYLIDQTLTLGNSWYYKTGTRTGSSSGVLTQSCVTFTPNYAGYMVFGDTLPTNAVLLCQSMTDYLSDAGIVAALCSKYLTLLRRPPQSLCEVSITRGGLGPLPSSVLCQGLTKTSAPLDGTSTSAD